METTDLGTTATELGENNHGITQFKAQMMAALTPKETSASVGRKSKINLLRRNNAATFTNNNPIAIETQSRGIYARKDMRNWKKMGRIAS